jgi:hypothetical protein
LLALPFLSTLPFTFSVGSFALPLLFSLLSHRLLPRELCGLSGFELPTPSLLFSSLCSRAPGCSGISCFLVPCLPSQPLRFCLIAPTVTWAVVRLWRTRHASLLISRDALTHVTRPSFFFVSLLLSVQLIPL